MIKLHTNFGVIAIEVDAEKAPLSARNFLDYVEAGHYDNTVFHRVIPGFMVQGGGFAPGMKQKACKDPIRNEATTGSRMMPTRSPWRVPRNRTRPPPSSSSIW
jgi:peptidyl-prolyl cis-trans isomerase B (cyclophilin B)